MNTLHADLFTNKAGRAEEMFGEDAQKFIKSGVLVLLDVLKTTLGPKGAVKILQDENHHEITNDGATILNKLQIDAPSACALIDASKMQDYEEGDGTTSIVLLAALILKHAYASKVQPIHIIKGLSIGIEKIIEILNYKKIKATKLDIENLVKTTLNSKILNSHLQLFTNICIDAINHLDEACDLNLINIIKLEGDLSESCWCNKLILDKKLNIGTNSNTFVENPKVLLINSSLDYDKIKIFSSKISVTSLAELEALEQAEKTRMENKINDICKLDFDVLINRQIIYDFPMHLLLNKKKYVIENADFDNIERLNKALGSPVLSHFFEAHDSDKVIGKCEKIETVYIKNKQFTQFTGIKRGASTILLYGSSKSLLDEAERSLHDALCVLKRIKTSEFILYGGGNTETMLGMELLKLSYEIITVESEGLRILSQALIEFVELLCMNCGFDSNTFKSAITSLYNLKTTYQKNNFTYGLNILTGKPGDMKTNKVIEGYTMKLRVLKAACETAQGLLKCDGLILHPPRERTRH